MVASELKEEVLKRLREVLDPDKVILFGSRSRGGARADSDIDLLVIKKGVEGVRREARQARAALSDLPAAFDVVVATPEQIERYGESVGLIYRTALAEGETWYEKPHDGPAT